MAHLAHYREAHPVPFMVTHWINMIAMFVLIISGLLIHFPAIPGLMGLLRGVHVLCGIIVLINMIVRVVLAFLLKSAQTGGSREGLDTDIKNFLPSSKNRHQFGSWIKYYLFIKKDHPLGSKYDSPQKITYFIILFLILISAFTGFALWGPTAEWGIFTGFDALVGGIINTRIIHYFMMWLFIIFLIIHIYLALIEGTAPAKSIFLGKESPGLIMDPEKVEIIGEDSDPSDPEAQKIDS